MPQMVVLAAVVIVVSIFLSLLLMQTSHTNMATYDDPEFEEADAFTSDLHIYDLIENAPEFYYNKQF